MISVVIYDSLTETNKAKFRVVGQASFRTGELTGGALERIKDRVPKRGYVNPIRTLVMIMSEHEYAIMKNV